MTIPNYGLSVHAEECGGWKVWISLDFWYVKVSETVAVATVLKTTCNYSPFGSKGTDNEKPFISIHFSTYDYFSIDSYAADFYYIIKEI